MTRAESAEPHGAGCKFAPRCPFADVTDLRCRQVEPPFFKPEPRRVVSCYRLRSSPTVPHQDLTKVLSEPGDLTDSTLGLNPSAAAGGRESASGSPPSVDQQGAN